MPKTTLIDLSSDIALHFASAHARSAHGGVLTSRFRVRGSPGVRFATAQFALLAHESAPVELSCRLAESDREETHRICAGQFHLMPAGLPADVRWTGEKQSLVITFEESFIERLIGEAFDGKAPEVRSRAALSDPEIEALVSCLRHEMTRNSFCSRLCLDYVGASLLIRVFEAYGDGAKPRSLVRGGLAGRRRKRVVEFIEAHLSENLSLAALAAESGLSAHHFGKAFKGSFGVAPHRYVTMRRIHRA